MMTFDDTIWLNTLLASNTLLVAAAGLALLRFQRLNRRRPSRAAAATEGSDIEQRMRRLERLADELSRRDGEAPRVNGREAPYEAAVRLVRQGAGAEDVASRCGLSRGETELLVRLHGSRT